MGKKRRGGKSWRRRSKTSRTRRTDGGRRNEFIDGEADVSSDHMASEDEVEKTGDIGNDLEEGFIVMVLISFLLIPNPLCTLWITLAMVSIDVGVVGFMSYWDVYMDPISMITLIMSIGFSVDFTAHITYGYVSSKSISPQEKTIDAMERLGWPVFQGALSTVLGVLVLGFVASYMTQVFFKTIFLVMVFGTLHALVFLPVVLSLSMPHMEKCWRRVFGRKDLASASQTYQTSIVK